MRLRQLAVLFALIVCVARVPAAVIGTSVPAQSLTAERIAAMSKPGQRLIWRAALARSIRQMAADRAFFQAELKAAGLSAPLIPPSGNSAKGLPLNKAPEWYGTPEAGHLADIVVSFQTPAGGWSKNLDLTDHARRPGESFAPNNLSAHLGPGDFDTPRDPQWNYVGTLDNDATTTELRFLAKVAAATPGKASETYRAAILHGLEYLLLAQYPNGGWPQVWPLEGGYHDAVTFNDGAVTLTLALLQDVAAGKDSFAFVPDSVRARARASVEKGLETILATQVVVAGHRTVWAQQHDALTLQPVAGRNYEPAALCASESSAMLLFLMDVPQPGPGVVSAVYAAVAWLRKVEIHGVAFERSPEGRRLLPAPGAGPLWSRFYEIGSDRPIFGDRDKSLHDDVNELSLERRNGYSWYNAAPEAALDWFAKWSEVHPLAK